MAIAFCLSMLCFTACGSSEGANVGNGIDKSDETENKNDKEDGNSEDDPDDNTEKGDKEDGSSQVTVTGITLNKTSLTLQKKKSETLVATVSLKIGDVELSVSSNAQNAAINVKVDWESSLPSVATVENGTVKAIADGEATITAKAGDKNSTCKLKVESPKIPQFDIPEGGFDTSQQVTITFYHAIIPNLSGVLDHYIVEFNKLYPNIRVTHEQIGSYDDVRDAVNRGIMQGKQPNIAYCYPDHVAIFNQANAVVPLNNFLADSDYGDMTVTRTDGSEEPLCLTQAQKDAFIQGFYNEGFNYGDGSTMYSLPFMKSAEVMYYNKTFFEKHNLKVPETWDEMEEVCAKIKAIDKNCTPLGYNSEANLFINLCKQYGSGYTSAEGEHFLFDNAKNRENVQRLQEWRQKGYFTTTELNDQYTDHLFTSQKSYMCIGPSASAKYMLPAKVNGEYPFETEIASIPQADPSNPKVIATGPSLCLLKQDDPQEVLASWLFVKFLTTCVDFQADYSVASGYLPVLNMDTMLTNAGYAALLKMANGFDYLSCLAQKVSLEQADAYFTTPAFVGSTKAREEVGNLLVAVLKHGKTLEEAFKDAIKQCNGF